MAHSHSARHRNHLLATLSADDCAALEARAEPIELTLRLVMEAANKPIKHVCFPFNGIVSVVASGPKDRKIEVGLVGSEGMSGISIILGDDRSPNDTFVQVAGAGLRLGVADLRELMQQRPAIRQHFLRYAHAFMTQSAHTALANGRAKVEERLARWLLMAHDRVEGDELALTHEFLSVMLGVRRAGVTTALNLLEEQALIQLERGRIRILDRAGLQALANGIYGIPEAEYRRLLGWGGKSQR
jgi:CRP-like cAMP-binding protein